MTDPIRIDGARAIQLLREVVAGKEDYVYKDANGAEAGGDALVNCAYAHGDEPGCVVGQVFHRAGVSVDVLRRMDVIESSSGVDIVHNRQEEFGLNMDYHARDILGAAQELQDVGVPWGRALAKAEEVAGEG